MKDTLAIHGGVPIRNTPMPEYKTIGHEEEKAVAAVIQEGVLSKFLAGWNPDFFGGPQVQALESEWASFFQVPHAVSVNSATSGLFAAIGASGVGPGDEVIVSPYTMSASAACILGYNAVPVFADIDPQSFCITAETIAARITPYTKAVVVVDLFGLPADFDAIMELARKHNLVVIEDAAQAPGAMYNGRYAGTLADMGVFSLNYHKTIHSGEGGIVVTANDNYAERIQLIRNHAEVVVDQKGVSNLINMLGFNYRMTEIEAAIAREQLKKLNVLVRKRFDHAERLNAGLRDIPGIQLPKVSAEIQHGYYVYAFTIDGEKLGVDRKQFSAAINAEGIPIHEGYVKPLYLQPLYQERVLYGETGCPFTCPHYKGQVDYSSGICPVTERLYEKELLYGDWCHAGMSNNDIDEVINGIVKVCNCFLGKTW